MSQPQPFSPTPSPRAAKLEARLALYAQYASLVGDEVAAAWSDAPAQAAGLTRELAAERRAIAERYAALADWAHDAAAPLTPEAFPGVLAGAVTELDHQVEVNRALRDRLEGLQSTGWVAGGASFAALPPGPANDESPIESAHVANEPEPAPEPVIGSIVPPELGGALVAARSSGVGGVLGGRYPGVVAGADATDYVTEVGGTEAAPAPRVDLRL